MKFHIFHSWEYIPPFYTAYFMGKEYSTGFSGIRRCKICGKGQKADYGTMGEFENLNKQEQKILDEKAKEVK